MPTTYAILGATGQTGGSVLEVLTSERPDVHINCLVRSRAKLERMYPNIVAPQQQQSSSSSSSSSSKIQVFEGPISNIPLLTDCIRGTNAVFMCVALPDNKPHLRIARDQAEAVVAALEALRTEQAQQEKEPSGTAVAARLPTLVVLSSAETDEERFCRDIPWAVRRVLFAANWWIYTDLIEAERYLRARAGPIGADAVFVKPGGIARDVRRGHVLASDQSQTFVSFLDVAGAMVECAEEGGDGRSASGSGGGGRWAGGSVSVLSRGKARIEWSSGLVLTKNLLCTWLPWLYPWLF